MSKNINEASMNISMNAADASEIADLLNVLKNAGVAAGVEKPMDMPMGHADGHDDMVSKMKMMDEPEEAPCGMDEEETDVEEEYENEPEVEYSDHHTMTKDLSGGINRQKKMHKPAAGGDNPIAIESIISELTLALQEKLSK
jgi:hypothetical protein